MGALPTAVMPHDRGSAREAEGRGPTVAVQTAIGEHDCAEQQCVLKSKTDPLIMYLVAPRRPQVPFGALLENAALAAQRCVQAFAGAPAWSAAFVEWERSAFRKVCLGACPVEFQRARTVTHARAGDVLCFPPRRRSAAEPELARLQAHTGGALQRGDAAKPDADTPVMVLLIAENLGLTLGKACAQVAHAALIGSELHRPAAITAWKERGQRIAVALVDDHAFQRAKSELVVATVRDAGLTRGQIRRHGNWLLCEDRSTRPRRTVRRA